MIEVVGAVGVVEVDGVVREVGRDHSSNFLAYKSSFNIFTPHYWAYFPFSI